MLRSTVLLGRDVSPDLECILWLTRGLPLEDHVFLSASQARFSPLAARSLVDSTTDGVMSYVIPMMSIICGT